MGARDRLHLGQQVIEVFAVQPLLAGAQERAFGRPAQRRFVDDRLQPCKPGVAHRFAIGPDAGGRCVLPGFVAQTGDPTGTGFGGPGYRFRNEVDPEVNFDRAGLVAMANSGADSNGSQFFITYDATAQLDGGFTIFGEVVEGMDVVESLTPRNPEEGDDLPDGDRITDVLIEEN